MPQPNRGPTPLCVADNDTLPNSADVVVIGGGIIGVATALELAQSGHSVCLLEKGIIAGEQSSRNWGWVRQAGRDLRELPLSNLARQRWQVLSQEIGPELGYYECGIVYTASTDAQAERHRKWSEAATKLGIDARLLDSDGLARKAPGLSPGLSSALFVPGDGRAEPQAAAPLIARRAMAKGCKVFQHCAALEIEQDRGSVSAVRTEQGRVATRRVVLAGGVWSGPMLRRMGIRLPQLKVTSSVYRTEPLAPAQRDTFVPNISLGEVSMRHRVDGGLTVASSSTTVAEVVPDSLRYMIPFLPGLRSMLPGIKLRLGAATWREIGWLFSQAAFEHSLTRHRISDPKPDLIALDRVQARLATRFPALAGLKQTHVWGGQIDVTPDVIPVISEVEDLPGLVIGTGFSGHGFGIGPGAGRVLAELASGQTPSVDLTHFRLSRFSDGTRVEVQSWL